MLSRKVFSVFFHYSEIHIIKKKSVLGFQFILGKYFSTKKMRAFLSCVFLKECGCYEPASQFLAGRFIFSVCCMSCSLLSFETFGDIHLSSSRILFPLPNVTVFVVRYPPMIRIFLDFHFQVRDPQLYHHSDSRFLVVVFPSSSTSVEWF